MNRPDGFAADFLQVRQAARQLGYNFIEKALRPQKNMLGCPLDLHL